MSGGAISAIAVLRILAELGDEGTGRFAETDPTLFGGFAARDVPMRVEKLLHQGQALIRPS
jgi:hypothetical protein